MQVHTFIADTAFAAVEQIRAELGPSAVVLNVRQLPADGLSRLWKKPRIEVLATIREVPATPTLSSAPAITIPPPDPIADLRQEMAELRAHLTQRQRPAEFAPTPIPTPTFAEPSLQPAAAVPYSGAWRVGPLLESSGILPIYAHRLVDQLCSQHGETPPSALPEEFDLTAKALRGEWSLPPAPPASAANTHVFVGPMAVGKTIFLSKWLARSVLIEGRSASVWRLDGRTANTAQSLDVYCDILGVPSERFIPSERPADPSQLLFIDLPGVAWNEPAAIADLKELLAGLGPAQVHLVLNLAYETPILLAQARAFALLPVQDLVLTHLDEEPRWQKAWNLVLGTNFSVGFLSAGQNVPGEWFPATPDRLLMRPLSRT